MPLKIFANTLARQLHALGETSCKKGDYTLGMIDFCPGHDINVATLHTQGRCNQHRRRLRAIHANKANAQAVVEARDARAALVRKHGMHALAPLAPRQ